MTQPQATAEVFYTAFQALKKSEREAFIAKFLQNEKLAEDFRVAAVIEKRKKEPTVRLAIIWQSVPRKSNAVRLR